MKFAFLYIIIGSILVISGLYFYQYAPTIPVSEPEQAAHKEQLPETVQSSAEQAQPELRQADDQETDLIAASRAILGQARNVIADFAAVNNKEAEELPQNGIIQGKVEKGETLAEIIENSSSSPAQPFINAAANVFKLRAFKAGQPYALITDPMTGQLKRFEYEVDDRQRLIIEGEHRPKARLEDIQYVTLLETCSATIDDSLFKAVADIGESPQLAVKLVELFGSEINFIRDLKSGDSFSILIEKKYREGEYRGYGRILAAEFKAKGKKWDAWLFRDSAGELHYYNGKGENLHKTLLMAPLAVTRLTSKFTHNRLHPILNTVKPHLGVDYGAPTGTPVKAVGAGVITKRGWAGGYGNQVIIKHNANLESMYAHLSGFARGLKEGQTVRQGQVIGFVGSTGLATGPHLDFRLRHKGNYIDPVKAINPRGAPVDPALKSAFKRVRELEAACLHGEKTIANYKLDSIVPEKVSLPQTEKATRNSAQLERRKRLEAMRHRGRLRIFPRQYPIGAHIGPKAIKHKREKLRQAQALKNRKKRS